jgi:hypothetical protein
VALIVSLRTAVIASTAAACQQGRFIDRHPGLGIQWLLDSEAIEGAPNHECQT